MMAATAGHFPWVPFMLRCGKWEEHPSGGGSRTFACSEVPVSTLRWASLDWLTGSTAGTDRLVCIRRRWSDPLSSDTEGWLPTVDEWALYASDRNGLLVSRRPRTAEESSALSARATTGPAGDADDTGAMVSRRFLVSRQGDGPPSIPTTAETVVRLVRALDERYGRIIGYPSAALTVAQTDALQRRLAKVHAATDPAAVLMRRLRLSEMYPSDGFECKADYDAAHAYMLGLAEIVDRYDH